MAPVKCVLCVIPALSGGGAERVLGTILRGFDRSAFRLGVATWQEGPGHRPVPDDVDWHNFGGAAAALVRLPALVRASRADVLCSFLSAGTVIAAAASAVTGVPLVATEHGPTALYVRDYGYGPLRRMLLGAAYRRSRSILTVSSGARDSLLQVFPAVAERVSIVPNGIDAAAVSAAAAAPSSVRYPRPYLTVFGRLSPEKGLTLAIDAVAELRARYGLDLPLVLVGDGPERARARTQAARAGIRCLLTGFLDDPYPVIAGAVACIVASRYESFSLAAAEAMACGTPVVTHVPPGGAQDLFRPGTNCIAVAEASPASYAAALASLCAGDDTSALRAAAAADVARRFPAGTMIRTYEEHWRNA